VHCNQSLSPSPHANSFVTGPVVINKLGNNIVLRKKRSEENKKSEQQVVSIFNTMERNGMRCLHVHELFSLV
jgi:hypothetical protein